MATAAVQPTTLIAELDALTDAELVAVRDQVGVILEQRDRDKKEAARNRALAILREAGLDGLGDLPRRGLGRKRQGAK